MAQGKAQKTIVTPGHLGDDLGTHRLLWCDPCQVERIGSRRGLAVDRDDVRQADCVLTRVVVAGDRRIREVLRNRERGRIRWEAGERHRPEILLEMTQQRMADALAEDHSTGDEGPADRAIGHGAQEETDVGHLADAVDSDRHGIDVHHRDAPSHGREIVVAEPRLFRVHLGEVIHGLILAPATPAAADRARQARTPWPAPIFRSASIRCIFYGVPTLDLTPDRIVTVARSLISKHGLSDFSMRKLAAALDVNPMTIYLRFDNKDALLDAVARASLAEFKAPPADGTWSDQVRALAIGLRNHLIHDRETLRLLNDADRLSAGLLGTLDRGLELMSAISSTGEDTVAAFRVLFWHVVGSALVSAAFDDFPGSRSDIGDILTGAGTTHTHLAAHAAHFGRVDGDDLFLRSTDFLIAGLLADTPKDNP